MKAVALLVVVALGLAVVVEQASPGFEGRQLGLAPPTEQADGLRDRLEQVIPKAPTTPTKPKKKKKPKATTKSPKVKLVGCKKPKRVPPGIPRSAFNLYVKHAGCDWWVVAGVYMVESTHGTSNAPGVKSGLNAFGCCAGPGQFHMGGTAQRYGLNRRTVYLMKYAVPASVRMLRDNGLGTNRVGRCASTARTYHVPYGTANALWNYNHACWYVAGTLAPGLAYYRAATR